jgi:thiol-disulfide isomerase/thioredoxin
VHLPRGLLIALMVLAGVLASIAGVALLGPGEPVPAFTLPGLAGPALTIPVSGQPVLLNYWASWCGPCLDELPLLSRFAAAQGPSGVQVVGIALDDRTQAEAFVRQHPLGFPSLSEAPGEHDSSVRLGNHRGVLPYSVLIGADGRQLRSHSGAFRDADDLRNWAEIR